MKRSATEEVERRGKQSRHIITAQIAEEKLETMATELFPGGYIPTGTILYHGSREKNLRFITGSLYFGLEPSISLWYILELHEKFRRMGDSVLYMCILTRDLPYVYTSHIRDHPSKNDICKRNVCLHPQFAYHGDISSKDSLAYNVSYELVVPDIKEVEDALYIVSFEVSDIIENLYRGIYEENVETLTYIYNEVENLIDETLRQADEDGIDVSSSYETYSELADFTIEFNRLIDAQKPKYELFNMVESDGEDSSDSDSEDDSDVDSEDDSDVDSEDASDSDSKDASDVDSEDVSDAGSEDVSDAASKDASDVGSEDVSDAGSEDSSDSASEVDSTVSSNYGDLSIPSYGDLSYGDLSIPSYGDLSYGDLSEPYNSSEPSSSPRLEKDDYSDYSLSLN